MFSVSDGIMFEGDLGIQEQRMVKQFIERYGRELLDMWETQQFTYLEPVIK
ncbi:MAG: DUF4160 domain-containing protein [Lachnospiraceae bacterium]|nr:DUF4160 domain-containing protein [Lachnospiraceae bacterium]